ncbi:hypothetical protein JL36_06050 [Lactococcus cremoris]|nr:hypothetical protein JL36_06050 [Lactococcus cremoris]
MDNPTLFQDGENGDKDKDISLINMVSVGLLSGAVGYFPNKSITNRVNQPGRALDPSWDTTQRFCLQ